MVDWWQGTDKDALKILGDKGKIPKWPANIDKAIAAEDKAFDAFDKVRNELKKQLLAEQNAVDALKNALSQFQDQVEEDALGLDLKNKDDKKKIDQARKILSDKIQGIMDLKEDDFKNLKELDKHLMDIGNYEPGS